MYDNSSTAEAMTIRLDAEYPPDPVFEPGIRRAPSRGFRLTDEQTRTALRNALRYLPSELHEKAAPEFLEELRTYGRIYAYRWRPAGHIKGRPIDEYEGRCTEGKAFQVQIDNNLDFDVALYPYELVTYGETGSVCHDWLQYRLIKKYLEQLTEDTTLVVMSGHPLGLFPSRPEAPRVIITNGLMVGRFDNQDDWELSEELGVANYGQMTAGGWMYIGPQGIVHGTFNTILNAGRLQLGVPDDGDLSGVLFVSSGLGGMSGAQPKAAEIAHAVGVIAEVDMSRIQTRLDQGWVGHVSEDLDEVFALAQKHVAERTPISIAYHGNIVDLLQYAVDHDIDIPLLSDQTSCHAAYDGGYCPQGLSFEQRTELLAVDRDEYRRRVDATLRKHFELVRTLTERGTYFFDYGYGPFRWVCLSGRHEDLVATDQAAMSCIDPDRRGQDRDNYIWIRDAESNDLVVGTQARILYQDAKGRVAIALRFNEMVRNGEIGPVMLGRDHHDVSGTDSPFRETSNIKDGSNVMADMATQCFAGNAARGMSLVTLHNGGGTGIGNAINGGFGLVLDGSERVDAVIRSGLLWDVMCGVARRGWARNEHSVETARAFNQESPQGHITLPYLVDDEVIDKVVSQ